MATKKAAEQQEDTKETIFDRLNSGTDKLENIAKQIWLAGLGAYGRSFDEVQNRFEKMNDESQRLFEELVARGEQLQADAEKRLDEGKSDLDARIEKLKQYAKMPGKTAVNDQLDDINSKLDDINKEIKKKA